MCAAVAEEAERVSKVTRKLVATAEGWGRLEVAEIELLVVGLVAIVHTLPVTAGDMTEAAAMAATATK